MGQFDAYHQAMAGWNPDPNFWAGVQYTVPTYSGGNPGTPTPTPTPAPSNPQPSGPSAADIQAMIDAAVKAEAERQANIRRQNAFDEAAAMFRDWGIDTDGSLMNTVRDWIWQDKSNDYILMEFRKTDAYNKRFTGMADLIKRGQFMNEAEYIVQERSYRNLMAQWELPKGFYDSYDDFGRFIANGVSVKELDDRIQSAKTILDEDTAPEYRQALRELGAGDGDLLAYVIDGDKAQSMIQKKLRTAAFAGAARRGGFDSIETSEFDRYANNLGAEYNNIDGQELAALQARLGVAGQTAARDEFLSSLENDGSFERADILDAEFLGDADKMLASQRRGAREKNRFSGSSGVGRNALGQRRNI